MDDRADAYNITSRNDFLIQRYGHLHRFQAPGTRGATIKAARLK